jgi:hypothetical protein
MRKYIKRHGKLKSYVLRKFNFFPERRLSCLSDRQIQYIHNFKITQPRSHPAFQPILPSGLLVTFQVASVFGISFAVVLRG